MFVKISVATALFLGYAQAQDGDFDAEGTEECVDSGCYDVYVGICYPKAMSWDDLVSSGEQPPCEDDGVEWDLATQSVTCNEMEDPCAGLYYMEYEVTAGGDTMTTGQVCYSVGEDGSEFVTDLVGYVPTSAEMGGSDDVVYDLSGSLCAVGDSATTLGLSVAAGALVASSLF